ncbi:hypothetical protein [Xanthomonas vasicola]|uniref:Uncharacterized protein n=1 Tax=Xanthomonas vasicola TaxID=56459 RepID=A0ABD7S7E3_XANVA|nr:hypothetical protein [Xanthomonas vasicola]AZR21519.1 hypothetical protein NX81_003140 [Xanthomonas vasicola]MDO6986191.1 hypothetical protein [Xanthomonas vasicola]TWQ26845.1 hypothetical protein FQJ97_03115 [Xanthomonas vasicola]TWQ36601.1 hypothetical protein FQJ96_15560 [Xanthomonas vasicola]TWQ51170.1 hypothetical protein FQK01_16170 [Xanthomonas vasicola]
MLLAAFEKAISASTPRSLDTAGVPVAHARRPLACVSSSYRQDVLIDISALDRLMRCKIVCA